MDSRTAITPADGTRGPHPESALPWPHTIRAVFRARWPLLLYEVLMSWLATSLLGPLLLALSYLLIELSGEPVLVNSQFAGFLLSPTGALALLLGLGVALGLILLEYSGLILLIDAALRGSALSLWQVVRSLAAAAPRLLGLAVVLVGCALVVAVPFLLLALASYWLLLSGTDINFYLAERPPRFWVAVAIGIVLAVGLAASILWLFVRWAVAVPACVLDGLDWSTALRSSGRALRGRTARLLAAVAGWLILKQFLLLAVVAGLDWFHHRALGDVEGEISIQLWWTVAILLLDAIAVQVLSAVFAIGLATIITRHYELARQSGPLPESRGAADGLAAMTSARPAWQLRAVVIAALILAPVTGLVYALGVAGEFVDRRPARVTGHRAGSKAAPENSLAALRLSIEAGADYVEIDVQQTADGHVVLLHDRDLRRVTGDPRNLNEVTLADLEALRLIDPSGLTDEKIPTLAEFIAACDGRIRLNVELKDFGDTPGLALAVLEVLEAHGYLEHSIVTSFQLPPLAEIKRVRPQVPVGVILSAVQGDWTRLPVDLLSINQQLVQLALVRRAHGEGMEVHVWTVNRRDAALRLLDLGCDNLLTSDPALMRSVVDEYAALGDIDRMLLRLRRWLR